MTMVKQRWLVFLGVLSALSVHAQPEPLQLGILLDTGAPLSVAFMDADFGDQMKKVALGSLYMGPFSGALHSGKALARNHELANRLRLAVGDGADRAAVYRRELTDAFANYTTSLDLVFLPDDLLVRGKPDFERIEASGIPYVAVFEESAGLTTPAPLWGTLAAYSGVELRVYDTSKKRRVLKEKIYGVGRAERDIDAAVDSSHTFLFGYPQAVRTLSGTTYWRLTGRNVLHELAKGTAYEDEFPSIQTIRLQRLSFDLLQMTPRQMR